MIIRPVISGVIRPPVLAALSKGGGVVPPPGFVFLVDTDGAYLIDQDGAYLLEAA